MLNKLIPGLLDISACLLRALDRTIRLSVEFHQHTFQQINRQPVIQPHPFRRIVTSISRSFPCVIIGFCSLTGWADAEITAIRENLHKALEYEDQTAREQSDWRNQKAELESLIILAKEEKQTLTDTLSAFRLAFEDLQEKKQALLKKKDSRTEILALLQQRLKPIKEAINRQYAHWPEMLQQDTSAYLAVMNNAAIDDFSNGQNKALGAALDILKAAGDFQMKINQGYQVNELADGNQAMYEVIFFGLAQGYYFSEDLGLAGSIVYQDGAWIWKENRKLLASLIRFSDFLSGNQSATLIELPLELDTSRKGTAK